MFVRFVAEEHVCIHVVRSESLAGGEDDVFEQFLSRFFVLGEEIERLHVYLGEQSFCRPFGSAEGVSGSAGKESYRLLRVMDHKGPGVLDGSACEFESLHIGDDGVNDREAEVVRLEFEENLCVPVRQRPVEIALPEHVVELFLLVRLGSVRAIVGDTFDSGGGELGPFAEVGISGGDIPRVDSGIVVL